MKSQALVLKRISCKVSFYMVEFSVRFIIGYLVFLLIKGVI